MKLIIKSLLQRKLGSALLILQMALALGLLVNSLHIADNIRQKSNIPTYLPAESTLIVSTLAHDDYDTDQLNYQSIIQQDIDALEQIASVEKASYSAQVPLFHGSSITMRRSDQVDGISLPFNFFSVGAGFEEVLGLGLLQGSWLTPPAMDKPLNLQTTPQPEVEVLISKRSAKALFGDEDPIGQFLDPFRARVVGVVSDIMADYYDNGDERYYTVYAYGFLRNHNYLIKVQPEHINAVRNQISDTLGQQHTARDIWRNMSLKEMRKLTVKDDQNLLNVFVILTALMLFLCLIGVYGHGQFHATQKSQEIGIRRALGVNRQQIMYYVLQENMLLSVIACIVGVFLCFALNILFSQYIDLQKPSLLMISGCALLLMVFALLTALKPAQQAANISPLVAIKG